MNNFLGDIAMVRYIEVRGIDGEELLLKVDAIRVVKRTDDGRAVVDGVRTRERYEDLKTFIANDDHRFIMDEGTDFRVRHLARTSIYQLAKEFGSLNALAYVNRVANADSEYDICEAREALRQA